MDLIERIDEARKRWNVLDHPFYRRWERGELTPDELGYYAGQYRHAVVALADTAAATGDATHAAEEAAHVDLWDDFAAAVDGRPSAASDATRGCADAWRRDDALDARAVLYAIEAGQPDVSRTKLTGLFEHYGFEPNARGTAYFELHAELDVAHAEASRRVLETVNEDQAERLVNAAEAALRGNWTLLDGVNAPRVPA